MSERYVRPTVAGWLAPTLLAPWISVYGAITAYAALGLEWGRFGKIAGWAAGMLVGSVWAFVFCAMLVAIDVMLLAVKARTLPAGRRGWLGALAAPFAVFAVYSVVPPHTFWPYGAWSVAAAVLVPMFAVALVVRVFSGSKPPR